MRSARASRSPARAIAGHGRKTNGRRLARTARVTPRATVGEDDERLRGLGERVRAVLRDSTCRLALATERAPQVGARPFSDAVFGFAFCAATFAALGVCDDVVKRVVGAATPFMIGAWGSLGVLAFGTLDAPPLRLWNVVAATAASATVSILCVNALVPTWLARSLSLSVSLVIMMRLGALHPPAGAVALAAMDAHYHNLQWLYVVYPALLGSCLILVMSHACQTLKRRYEFSFGDAMTFVAEPFRARARRD